MAKSKALFKTSIIGHWLILMILANNGEMRHILVVS